jgi:hypothetical protein
LLPRESEDGTVRDAIWTKVLNSVVLGERKVFEPDILEEAEKQVHMVKENLRVAQSRQKRYADHRRRELSFDVGDFVYLKVSPMRGLRRFKVRGKLALDSLDRLRILEKRGVLAYQLELPPQLSNVHDVFPTSLWFFRRRWHPKRTTVARDRRNSDELGQPVMEHHRSARWRRRPLPNLICNIHHKPSG